MLIAFQILLFVLPFAISLGSPWRNLVHPFYIPSFIAFLGIWIFTRRLSLKKFGNMAYPLMLFLLSLLISFAFSTDREKSFHAFYPYVLCLLLFFVTSLLSYAEKGRVIKTLLLSAFSVSLFAIHQYFVIFPEVIDYLRDRRIDAPFLVNFVAQKRVMFPFTTPNILGGYLAMLLPLTWGLVEGRILIFLCMAYALILTQSLSGLISIFFAFVVFFLLRGSFKKGYLYILIGVASLIMVTFFMRTSRYINYLQPLFSWHMRFDYWRESVKIITAHPWTGIGLGAFDLPQCRFAHNSYLQIWGEMGLLGILSFLWLVGIVIKNASDQLRSSNDKRTVCVLLAGITAFLVHNIVDFSFFLPEASCIGWILLGLIYRPDRTKPAEGP